MADSKRMRILTALKTRLQDIKPANGYATDAGLRVRLGPGSVTPDDLLPRLALIPGVEPEVRPQLDKVKILLPFVVEGLIEADPNDPDDPTVIEPLLADSKRAVFRATDRTLGGLAINLHVAGERVTGRENGGRTVACAVSGVLEYTELYGDPELA
jgi:hypothetical protein